MLPNADRPAPRHSKCPVSEVAFSLVVMMKIALSGCGNAQPRTSAPSLLPTATPLPRFSSFYLPGQVNAILKVDAGHNAAPFTMTAGPDGAIWMCGRRERGENDFIARMTTDGVVTNVWLLSGPYGSTTDTQCGSITAGAASFSVHACAVPETFMEYSLDT